MTQQQLPVKDLLSLCHLPYRKGQCTLKKSTTRELLWSQLDQLRTLSKAPGQLIAPPSGRVFTTLLSIADRSKLLKTQKKLESFPSSGNGWDMIVKP